jgi:hypothetical protein
MQQFNCVLAVTEIVAAVDQRLQLLPQGQVGI